MGLGEKKGNVRTKGGGRVLSEYFDNDYDKEEDSDSGNWEEDEDRKFEKTQRIEMFFFCSLSSNENKQNKFFLFSENKHFENTRNMKNKNHFLCQISF